MVGVVTDVRTDTPDVKTFRVVGLDGKKPFEHIPGQCAMLSMPGIGEALFSITSSPTTKNTWSSPSRSAAASPPGSTRSSLDSSDTPGPLR